MFGESDPSIACMVLDSPFSSLKTLATELVEKAEVLLWNSFLFEIISMLNICVVKAPQDDRHGRFQDDQKDCGEEGQIWHWKTHTDQKRFQVLFLSQIRFEYFTIFLFHAFRCFIPALFAHGTEDDFIAPSHSKEISAQYAGDHNLVRPHSYYSQTIFNIRNFIYLIPIRLIVPRVPGCFRFDFPIVSF